jgi:hypothetical protein
LREGPTGQRDAWEQAALRRQADSLGTRRLIGGACGGASIVFFAAVVGSAGKS